MRGFSTAAIATAWLVFAGGGPAGASDNYYEGKTVRLVNAGSEAGSYAIYTRILARHLPKHIPGNPTMVTDYMQGGGGLRGQNYFYNAAPKDGLVLGMPMPSIVTSPFLYPNAARFEPSKFIWIGNITQLQTVIGVMKATSPATTLEEAMEKEVILASTGRGSELELTPRLLNEVLGTKFKIVTGYKGVGAVNMAMETGEVHGRSGGYTSWPALKPDWFQPERRIAYLAQLGLTRHPEMSDVPLVTDFARNEDDRLVLELLARSTVLTRAVLLPPGVSSERAREIRAAFDATLKDPEYLAEMKKANMLMIDPMNAEEVEKFIAETEKTPDHVKRKFQQILQLE
jgi:tripartite-type tricarboxylate transporter receptor subunit TctC